MHPLYSYLHKLLVINDFCHSAILIEVITSSGKIFNGISTAMGYVTNVT